jgi:hypothetical protein
MRSKKFYKNFSPSVTPYPRMEDLFEQKVCSICGENPGRDERGMWNGFIDCETEELICWHCRKKHYENKKQKFNGMIQYVEMPVYA